MRFIRVHGRVVPIQDDREPAVSAKKAALAGAATGAAVNVASEYHHTALVSKIPNNRSVASFQSKLKIGDILVIGSTPKHSQGYEIGETIKAVVPKKLQKVAYSVVKKVGLKKNTVYASNASVLAGIGAGDKYHAAIYTGNGKMTHMLSEGASVGHLKYELANQNVTALRFSGARAKETRSAVSFAKRAVAKKVPYQAEGVAVKNAINSVLFPLKKTPTRSFTPMVCNTLPIRAYNKRSFGWAGEHVLAGDFKAVPGLKAVARRDVILSPAMVAKKYLGKSARGIKWGILAGAGALAINQLTKKRKEPNV